MIKKIPTNLQSDESDIISKPAILHQDDNDYITRGELRSELAYFKEELRKEIKMEIREEIKLMKDQILAEFRQILFEAMQLQREYFDKKFEQLETRLAHYISKTAVDQNKIEARLTHVEKESGIEFGFA